MELNEKDGFSVPQVEDSVKWERDKAECESKLSARKPLNIVMLFEGTCNHPLQNPSAISELKYVYKVEGHRRILPESEDELDKRLVDDASKGQVVHLVSGSGTHGKHEKLNWVRALTGGDWPLIVKKQYTKLKQTLQAHQDEEVRIFVFGFSRGAYQAKIFVNGILYFGVDEDPDVFIKLLEYDMKDGLSIKGNVPSIEFVGLIDTVSYTWWAPRGWRNVGIPSKSVKECRHALAINEYRSRYKPQILYDDLENVNAKNIKEKWFIGAHSDVGWAYNGMREQWPNQAYTQNFGSKVLSWLLEDVSSKLKWNLDEFEECRHTAYDYMNTLRLLPFLIHDSYMEKVNFFSKPVVRYAEHAEFHHSVEGVRALTGLSVAKELRLPFKRLDRKFCVRPKSVLKIVDNWIVRPIQRLVLRFCGRSTPAPETLSDYIDWMVRLQGGPAFDIGEMSKDEIKESIKNLNNIDTLKEAYDLLVDATICSHTWEEELIFTDDARHTIVLTKRANCGDVSAQLIMGCRCFLGKGVRRNPVKATDWWRKAAAQGDKTASLFLSVYSSLS